MHGLDEALQELGIYVGSAILRHAAEQAGIAAESDLPILLLGETGTGKERFAHLIHKLSPRNNKELIPINCAAIPESIAESYLFGHTKGAAGVAGLIKAVLAVRHQIIPPATGHQDPHPILLREDAA